MSYCDKSVVVYGCKISDNDFSAAFENNSGTKVGQICVVFSGDSRIMLKPEVLGMVVSVTSSDDALYEPFKDVSDHVNLIAKINDEAKERGLTLVSEPGYYCIPMIE